MARLILGVILGLWLTGCTYEIEDDMRGRGRAASAFPGSPESFQGKDGWSAFGQLATGQDGKQANVGLSAVFEESDLYTVQFNIDPPNNPPAGFGLEATGTVTWKVEGGSVVRQVSVGNGSTISGVAQGVKVVVNDITTTAANFPNEGYNYPANVLYTVSIQVARGGRPTTAVPPILFGYHSDAPDRDNGPGVYGIPAQTTIHVPVPQNAGISSIQVGAVVDNGIGGGVIAAGDLLVIPSNSGNALISPTPFDPTITSGNFVPLGPGVNRIGLLNFSNKPVVVSVAFGIDG